jgi:hypothetical protein
MERRVFPGTRLLSSFAVAALFAASPAAADGPVQLSLGYSYAKYLGEGDGRTAPVGAFLHVLGGARHDRIEGLSDTIWGGFAGGGLDLEVGEGLALRLGADFQMFFDEGEDVKTLRLGVGLTF